MDACNEGDFSKVRKLLDEGRVSVHDTTEEGESLLSLACSAGYYELAQVRLLYKYTVWKMHDFSSTHILREIEVWDSRSAKYAILTHLNPLNFDFL